jgi:DNA-binding NarL/FixJ family response regulator
MNKEMQGSAIDNKPKAHDGLIKALLVDDSPVMLSTLVRILEKEERITLVGSATNGWLALRTALQSPVDLALVDLHLPQFNGAEVTRYLKLLPNPPVVFIVTSDDSPNARAISKAAGADAFIVKAANLEVQIRSELRRCFLGGANSA